MPKLLIEKKFFLSLLLLVILNISFVYGGKTDIWIERADSEDKFAYIGDKVKFNILADTHGEKITGVAAYLTFDPEIFEPVPPVGEPFNPGTFLKTSVAVINNTHGDSLHLYNNPGWGNGIDGYQLDYYQSTGPTIGGVRPSARGMGIIATFELKVINMPVIRQDSTLIKFDFENGDNRLSTYYLLDEPGNEQRFSTVKDYKISITGFRIFPPIPDTLITPGSTLQIDLDDHVASGETSQDIDWSVDVLQNLENSSVKIENNILTVSTNKKDHGVIKLRVIGLKTSINFMDYQDVNIGVDIPPSFKVPQPSVIFNEDEKLKMPKNAFFTDADDNVADVSVLILSNFVHVDNKGDSLTFYADPNWYGKETVRLFLQDAVQAQITGDTLKTHNTVEVLSVNDPPVLNVSSLDPVIMYNKVAKTITMTAGTHVTDVDDNHFSWSVSNNNSNDLIAVFNDNVLTLESVDKNYTGIVPITITVKDNHNASDTETVNVRIESPPLSLKEIPDILVFPDSTATLYLNNLVNYPDAAKADLTWTFVALNAQTKEPDHYVSLSYDPLSQRLQISAASGHRALDELYFTVTDGNSTDTKKANLKIFDVKKLSVFPLPIVQAMRGTSREVIDLDDYVIDIYDDISQLKWEVLRSDSLKKVTIDSITHLVTIETNTTFLGTTNVVFKVTNSRGEYDTGSMEVRCIEYNPAPIISPRLPDITLNWKNSNLVFYADLDDHIWDLETPDSLIVWNIQYDHSFVNCVRDPENNIVKMSSFDKTGKQYIIFTARNKTGYSSSDTILVRIDKQNRPVWQPIPDIEFTNSQIYNSLYLKKFCSDPGGMPLTFSATCQDQNLDVRINQSTTQVTFTPLNGFSGKTSVVFTASNGDTSSTSNLVNVTLISQSGLSCFFNSILPNRVNFVVNTEPQVISIDYDFVVDLESLDLNFKLNDSSAVQKIWMAPYVFTKSGLFKLNVNLKYPNGLEVHDSLWLTLQLGKFLNKSVFSGDNKLQVRLREEKDNNTVLALMEKSNRALNGFSDPGKENYTLYTIKSAGFEDTCFNLVYNHAGENPYYSFFTVDGETITQIETTTDHYGHYYAKIKADETFFFATAGTPAREEHVPQNKIMCYPNPFNSSLKIRYLVQNEKNGEIKIFNILGQTIYTFELNELEAGLHDFNWHGINQNNLTVPTGVYFIQIKLGDKTNLTSKVLLIR
ncbi:T9SS type A sorting domain-containing protein [candidate division KSB1 bacterium]|nr:T9SS type A sorting domain-containing protein [candidate division KSB1 bacterium]